MWFSISSIYASGTAFAISFTSNNQTDRAMFNETHASISSTQHLRHDLMIELGRLEMAMEDASQHKEMDRQAALENLQHKHARVSAALDKLPQDS
jgi:hypothetical protein